MRRPFAPTSYLNRPALAWFSIVVMLVFAAPLRADDEEDEDDLGLPGLAAVHQELLPDGREGLTVVDPAPRRLAMSLAADESPHPAIPAGPFRTTYSGRLFVQRPGKYTFRVESSGSFLLNLGKQTAVNGAGVNGIGLPAAATPVELKYGQVELTAVFVRSEAAAPAELRVFWRREGEPEFALPMAVLSRPRPQGGESPEAAADSSFEEGRRLVAEHRCAACHTLGNLTSLAGQNPVPRGAILHDIGSRASETWMHRWLADPKAVRSLATMPDLFGDTPAEQADLYAAAKYLGSLKDKKQAAAKPAAVPEAPDVASVRKSMASVGCIACHLLPGEDAAKFPSLRPLTNLGDKTTAAVIEKRIAEPRAFHPSSRMPDFELEKEQPKLLRDIAAYLADQHASEALPRPKAPTDELLQQRIEALYASAAERDKLAKLPTDERWRLLGALVVETRGCLNCHDLDKRQTKLTAPSLAGIADKNVGRGCLSAKPEAPAARYSFTDARRVALAEALQLSPKQKPAKAPLYAAERELERSGCVNCHSNGRAESAFARRLLSFTQLGTDQTIHDLAPPNLAGIGEKLTANAMQSVVDGKTRARPWMALRMPLFGPEQAKGLGTGLAALDGLGTAAATDDATNPLAAAVSDEDIEIGRQLVGRTGLNCVSCHDIRGIPSMGVRGPDLAKVPGRVRSEWFRSWLLDPQRFAPGTRMPTVFFAGKSAAPQYLDGDPERQIAALWGYLSQGSKMELPSLAPPANAIVPGGENPKFMPTERPLIARGFMPGIAGMRGIALGTPQGTHFAFDSERCILSAAWNGDFAEIGGWFDNGRGTPEDNALKPLGKMVWRVPGSGVEGGAAGGNAVFYAKTADASFTGQVKFRSAWATPGDSGFSYDVEVAPGKFLHVEERLQPTPDGFSRRFTLRSDEELPELRLPVAVEPARKDAVVLEPAEGVKFMREVGGGVSEIDIDKLPPKTVRTFVVVHKTAGAAEGK